MRSPTSACNRVRIGWDEALRSPTSACKCWWDFSKPRPTIPWHRKKQSLSTRSLPMSNYRRWYVPGGTYFFTVVTQERRPILTTKLGRHCLRNAIHQVRVRYPFDMVAIVLLPDHFHTIWTLPEGDSRYSTRLRRIKDKFTTAYLRCGGEEALRSDSRVRTGERGIWQRRFWEHTIESEDDFENCFNYLHWNPVKHGLVKSVCEYRWSTFSKYVTAGIYDLTWGTGIVEPVLTGAEWD